MCPETSEHKQAVADLVTKPILNYLKENYPIREFYATNCSFVCEVTIVSRFKIKEKRRLFGLLPKTIVKMEDVGWGEQNLKSYDSALISQRLLEDLVERGRVRQIYHNNLVVDNLCI